jgi:hypothetical protein
MLREMLEQMNQKLDVQVSRQKHAASALEQPGVKYIQGQDPVNELLSRGGEQKLLHSALFKEEQSFSKIEADGAHITVVDFVQDGQCHNPRCGICNAQDQKQNSFSMLKVKIVSFNKRDCQSL